MGKSLIALGSGITDKNNKQVLKIDSINAHLAQTSRTSFKCNNDKTVLKLYKLTFKKYESFSGCFFE